MYSMDDFVNDTFFHNKLGGNPLALDQGVNTSRSPCFLSIKLYWVSYGCYLLIFLCEKSTGSLSWKCPMDDFNYRGYWDMPRPRCQGWPWAFVSVLPENLFLKYYILKIAKNPLDNLMSSVPGYFQSLL